jgi:hypothetical protein
MLPGGSRQPGSERYQVDEAVKVLLDKLLISGPHQQRREKLLKALDDASQRYGSSTQKERTS